MQKYNKLISRFTVSETLMALFIFLLPLVYVLHSFMSEHTNELVIFGYRFVHSYISNSVFGWYVTWPIVSLSYLILWIVFSKRSLRICAFFPILVILYRVSRNVWNYPNVLNETTINIICIVFLITGLFVLKKRATDITEYNGSDILFSSAIILFCTLHFFSYHDFFQETTITVYGYQFSSIGFNSVFVLLYFLTLKLIVILPLLYWFFTENKWWKYALLSPIIILSMQVYNSIFRDGDVIDEIEVFQTLHITIPLLLILLFLARINENQERIGLFLRTNYHRMEHLVMEKYQKKEEFILTKKRELNNNNETELVELEKLKVEIEQELNNERD